MPVNTDKSTISKLKKELSIAHRDLKKASTLFSSIGEAVIVTDEYGRIERVNSLTEKILGYSSNEMIGQRFFNIVKAVNEDGTLIPEIDRPITKAFLRGSAVFERLYYLTKYNSMVPIDTNVSPIIFNNKPSDSTEVIESLVYLIEMPLSRARYSKEPTISSHKLSISMLLTLTVMFPASIRVTFNNVWIKSFIRLVAFSITDTKLNCLLVSLPA